jgi:serine/threonine-protein kinase
MVDGSRLPEAGDTIADKYRIERLIGRGGMSVVYGATHLVTGKRFAIKWHMSDEAIGSINFTDSARRFIREAQVAGLFQHPNVVEVYDVGQVSGSFYMVMEWLEGESLDARLERAGRLSFEETCAFLIPCMRGVDEAHAAGIVHRDLKPANIFVCRATKHAPEYAKVLDFGIAKLAKRPDEINSLVTKTGVLIGTPHFLAPEQLRDQPVDQRTDIYALGVILYQLLSGQLPFLADNFGQLVLQIATGTPKPLHDHVPGLSPGIEEVVARAMAREPSERFQDVRALIDALVHLAENAPGFARMSHEVGVRPSGRYTPAARSSTPAPVSTPAQNLATHADDIGTPPVALHTPAAEMHAPRSNAAASDRTWATAHTPASGLSTPLSIESSALPNLLASPTGRSARRKLPYVIGLLALAVAALVFLGVYLQRKPARSAAGIESAPNAAAATNGALPAPEPGPTVPNAAATDSRALGPAAPAQVPPPTADPSTAHPAASDNRHPEVQAIPPTPPAALPAARRSRRSTHVANSSAAPAPSGKPAETLDPSTPADQRDKNPLHMRLQ